MIWLVLHSSTFSKQKNDSKTKLLKLNGIWNHQSASNNDNFTRNFLYRESFNHFLKAWISVYCWLGREGKAGGLFLAGIGGKLRFGTGGAPAGARDVGDCWFNTGGGSLGCDWGYKLKHFINKFQANLSAKSYNVVLNLFVDCGRRLISFVLLMWRWLRRRRDLFISWFHCFWSRR